MDMDLRVSKQEKKNLDCEEVPIDNTSHSMTPGYNVSVAEGRCYLLSLNLFAKPFSKIRVGRTFTFHPILISTYQWQSQRADQSRRTPHTPRSTPCSDSSQIWQFWCFGRRPDIWLTRLCLPPQNLHSQDQLESVKRWLHFTTKRRSSHPGSLGHPLDVDVLGIFEIAFQIEGPKHSTALVIDEKTSSLKAVRVSSCNDGVPIQEKATDSAVSGVI